MSAATTQPTNDENQTTLIPLASDAPRNPANPTTTAANTTPAMYAPTPRASLSLNAPLPPIQTSCCPAKRLLHYRGTTYYITDFTW